MDVACQFCGNRNGSVVVIKRLVTALSLAILVGSAVLVESVFTNNIKIVAIASNSMLPKWGRGALLVLEKVPIDQLKVGQAVYAIPPRSVFPDPVVHQIIYLWRGPGGVVVRTKGVANRSPDIWEDMFRSDAYVVRWSIPDLGYLAIWR